MMKRGRPFTSLKQREQWAGLIAAAMLSVDGNAVAAARALGWAGRTFYSRVRICGISLKALRADVWARGAEVTNEKS